MNKLLARFLQLIEKNNIPSAILLTGPRHAKAHQLAEQMIGHLVCDGRLYCQKCRSCEMFMQGLHSDFHQLGSLDSGAPKIDEVRAIQTTITKMPRFGDRHYVLLFSVDNVNQYTANALLKTLEEPPNDTLFILIGNQIDSVLPTILSRCQIWKMPLPEYEDNFQPGDYLSLMSYCDEPDKIKLLQSFSMLLENILNLIQGESTPSTFIEQHNDYAIEHMLWFLYLLVAQIIFIKMSNTLPKSEEIQRCYSIFRAFPINRLFKQLDNITNWQKKIRAQSGINNSSVLEAVLLGFLVENN